MGIPPMDGLCWKIPVKWMIWGYPYFRKPPYMYPHRLAGFRHVRSYWQFVCVTHGRLAEGTTITPKNWCHPSPCPLVSHAAQAVEWVRSQQRDAGGITGHFRWSEMGDAHRLNKRHCLRIGLRANYVQTIRVHVSLPQEGPNSFQICTASRF